MRNVRTSVFIGIVCLAVLFFELWFTSRFLTPLDILLFLKFWGAMLFWGIGFFIAIAIFESNKRLKTKKRRYISSFLCYMSALLFFNWNFRGFAPGLESISPLVLDIAAFFFSLVLLYVAAQLAEKQSFLYRIKNILSFILCIIFAVKYFLIMQHLVPICSSFSVKSYALMLSIAVFYTVVLGIYGYTVNRILDEGGQLIPAVDFDKLESALEEQDDFKNMLIYAGNWIRETLDASFVGYAVPSANGKLSIVYYMGDMSLKKYFLQMVKKREKMEHVHQLLLHPCGGFSVPLLRDTRLLGFGFAGKPQSGIEYTEQDLRVCRPLVRILSKTLLSKEVEQARNEKNILQFAFSKYVSPEVVNTIMLNPGVSELGGEKRVMSVIFTDLQGFTELSDSMDPAVIVRVLNSYFTEMTEVIIALGGTIDKFEGDAILAFFGAPNPMKDHAFRCCKAALGMKRMEKIVNEQLLREGIIKHPLHTRIGINTGEMIVGNIGSAKRLEYTIIGSNVNIASRIETINKEFGTSVLISEQTWNLVKDDFTTRYVDTVRLRGVSNPLDLYELLEEKNVTNLERSTIDAEIASLMRGEHADFANFSDFVDDTDVLPVIDE